MKKLAENITRVVLIMPTDLYQRLVRQAGKETADRGRKVTVSHVIRYAVEEYLDMWETAQLVSASAPAQEVK